MRRGRAARASAVAIVVLAAGIAAVQSGSPSAALSTPAEVALAAPTLAGTDCIVLNVNGSAVYTAPACAPTTTAGATTSTTQPASTTSSAATTTTVAPTTTTTSVPATTTTAAPTTTTSVPPGVFDGTFSSTNLSGWVFAHGRASTSQDGQSGADASVVGGKLLIRNGEQNYGDATLRSLTKYDLTNGGTVSLDISSDTTLGDFQDSLSTPYVMFSSGPQDGKLQHSTDIRTDPYSSNVPTEGVTIWLRDNCRVPWAPPVVVTYPVTAAVQGQCAAAPDGKLRLVYASGHLSIQNGAGLEIVAYNVTLPPTGFLTLGVHNHASIKYASQPSITGTFDNVVYPVSTGGTPPTTTTTPATSTTAPVTTTTTVTSTTIPPPGNFIENFSTPAGVARFDFQLHTSNNGTTNTNIASTFIGEHDLACGDPTTHRTVHGGQGSPAFIDVSGSELIWYCAPGNDPAKGHMMTALDTTDIATLSFSPKQTFNNVTQVCWDQNMNNMGEAKWVNVFVVSASDVAADGDLNYAAAVGLPFGGVNKRVPASGFQFTWLRGSTMAFKGYTQTMDFWKSYMPGGMVPDNYAGAGGVSAPRFTICLNSNGGTSGNMVINRPDGTVDTRALGAAFPTGPVKVIFQDASYNPVKHNGSVDHLSWHWDNLVVIGS